MSVYKTFTYTLISHKEDFLITKATYIDYNALKQCFPKCAPVHSSVHINYFTVHKMLMSIDNTFTVQCFPKCAPVHSSVHINYFTVPRNFDDSENIFKIFTLIVNIFCAQSNNLYAHYCAQVHTLGNTAL